MNIAIITLDSLRYDVAMEANTPNFDRLGKWERTFSHGDNTLPSHVALFQGGQVPYSLDEKSKYYYKDFRFFRAELNWDRDKEAVYKVPEAENIVRGFDKLGYWIVGIGGVHWFDDRYKTSSIIWKNYFDDFYWEENFAEENSNSFEYQLKFIEKVQLRNCEKLFFFLNISHTHIPFHRGDGGYRGQVLELEYVDSLFPRLIDLLPRPCHYLVFGDHGTCFGDDGLWGHGFYHKKVLEMPMMDFIIK